jgi:YD repeat-containing protein
MAVDFFRTTLAALPTLPFQGEGLFAVPMDVPGHPLCHWSGSAYVLPFTDSQASAIVSSGAASGGTTLPVAVAKALAAQGLVTGVTYDPSGRATSWTIDGVTYTATYSATEILVTADDGTLSRVSLDGSGRFAGLALA